MNRVRRIRLDTWTIPIALFVLSIGGYILLIPTLGFYMDDWYIMWFAREFGSRIFITFFSKERPFLAGIYVITNSILGQKPVYWLIFFAISRALAGYSVWWTLRQLWPRRIYESLWIAILFTVYPGFRQQFIAVLYSHVFLILALHITSLGLMIKAIRHPSRYWVYTILAWLGMMYSIVSVEYFFALELLRPVILWLVIGEEVQGYIPRLKRVFMSWLPYLVGIGAFLYWRLFYFGYPTYQPELAQGVQSNFLVTLAQLARTILQDALDVTVFLWEETWEPLKAIEAGMPLSVLATLLIALVVAFCTIIYLTLFRPKNQPGPISEIEDNAWAKQAITLGIFSIITAGIPFWFVGLPVELREPWDRFTLAFIFGASLLWVALISLFVKTNFQKVIIIGIAVGLAVSIQFKIGNSYRLVHQLQGDFFRQLTWRIPDLEPDTVILTNELPIPFSSDRSLMAPLNWIYTPKTTYPEMDYLIFYLPERVGKNIPELIPDIPIFLDYRSLLFNGNTSRALVVNFNPPSCVHVLNPNTDLSRHDLDNLVTEAIHLSNIELIVPEENGHVENTVKGLFGPSPSSSWCYYYEKAELARQREDWDQVVQNAELALKLDKQVQNETELLPYIEGYAHLGDGETAFELTKRMVKAVPSAQPALCAVWERIESETAPDLDYQSLFDLVYTKISCPPG